MPLDPSIAFGAIRNQQQQPNALDSIGRVMQLRHLAQAGEMQDLQLEQEKMAMKSQQVLQQSYAESNGDPEATFRLAAQRGARMQDIVKAKSALLEEASKRAGLQKTDLENRLTRNDLIHGALTPILQEQDPAKQEAMWNATQQRLVEQGVMSPQEAQQHPYPGSPEGVKQYANFVTTDKWITAQAAHDSAAARKTTADTGEQRLAAELPGIQASNQIKALEAAGQKPIQPYEAAQLPGIQASNQIKALEAAGQKPIQPYERAQLGQGAQRLGLEQQRVGMEKERNGFDMSGGVSPAAQMAADGRMSPQTLRSMLRHNPGLMSQIQKLDPQFDETQIENRYATLKEFTATQNNRAGGQVLALNTLIHHADLYQKTAEALKNGTFRPGNEAYNAVAKAFGSAPPTSAPLVARFLAGETGKVATGGVPAEGEVNGILQSLGTAGSPEQIADAGNKILQIAAGKMVPLKERRDKAKLQSVVDIIGPHAKEILAQRGIDPDTLQPKQAGGAQSPAYGMTATGKDGHKIGSNDGRTWFDLQTGKRIN